ncbi:hypothetical protein C8C85_3681 [Flavobacterium sp. 103]|uniref:hypothetical protein n=1 Tax=Flavobacterium sp. 103 TaxID=2135624 RepID=UPI000D5F7E47|nr:hypothetical protein [Flavobacterium sp. 103]PVX47726.1 hypothetical protein C8C85_3681 [Flavobacterium sp. 103]
MKNIIPEIDTNQIREFIDQKDNKFGYDQNQYSIVEQKQKKKKSSKFIKGKVKVYNSRAKLINSEYHDDESELNLVSERMLLFLKFTFLFLILTVFFLFLKKSI